MASRKSVRLLAALALLLAIPAARAEEVLPVLARIGPWPVASRLIDFRGRLWLANSVKGVNHNSADLYSYEPATGELRYERQLFSQDAGRPAVADGLLYWPFEDARASQGFGHFMVTDGARWRLGTIPTARIFHTHAMARTERGLLAATSAWRAGLQLSTDRGRSWRQVYDHPTPSGRVTRVVRLVTLGARAFGEVVGNGQRRLLRVDDAGVSEVPGWPRDRPLVGLASWRGRVYGVVIEDRGAAVWRTDGARSERIAPPRPGWAVVDLTAGDDGLLAVTAGSSSGAVWHSADGGVWQLRHRLPGGRPHELLSLRGAVYVAGAGADGRGVLWGSEARPPGLPVPLPAALPERSEAGGDGRDWTAAGLELDRVLADPTSYVAPGPELRDLVFELARAGPPVGFFGARLEGPLPTDELALIGGNVRVPAAGLARWALLWGMSLAGRGQVPVALIAAPWTAPRNPSEKYFDPAPAAMWTAGLIGQDDPATIDALLERLGRSADPLWLRGDAVGALTALTGERLGYDEAAWRAWRRRAALGRSTD